MKKKLSIFLILVLLINLLIPSDFTEGVEEVNPYDKSTNTFKFTTDTPIVSSGVAYRTVGFKAHFNSNGKDYEAYFTMKQFETSEPYPKLGRMWTTNYFRVPLSGDNAVKSDGTTPIYESFDRSYTDPVDRENIAAFFANNNTIYLDGIFTKVYNGVEKGTFTVGTDGKPNPQGTIWMTKQDILGSEIEWTKSTQSAIETYYNIPLGYVAQPVGDLKPVISRLDENNQSVVEPSGVYTFKEGEPINLVGVESTFPNKTVPLGYKWRYKKQGASTFATINPVSTPSSVMPSTLEVGTYTVELETTATYERPWDSTPVTKSSTENKNPPKVATATLVIEKNPEPMATAVISSPSEIMLDDLQNTVSIPVTLNTGVLNVEPTDILSVELQISTFEKDQTRSQTFFPSLNQSMSHSFTIAYNGTPKNQWFEGKAIVNLKGGGVIESPLVKCSTYLFKTNNNLPPVPILKAPEETLVGSVYISGSQSFDVDGNIVLYDFSIPSIGFYQEDTKSSCFPTFMGTGNFQVIMGVTDDDGARSETSQYIKVTPVPPSIELTSVGFYKENRKITLKAMNWTESMSAVGENYNWTIKPMDVTNPQSNVKMVSTHGKQIDVLMKKAGKYLVTCTGKNTYNLSDTKTMILNVVEDKAPIMVVDSTNPKFRDGTRIATVKAYDHSYSNDGDFIKSRTWSYKFDSDNDGSFADETAVALKSTSDYTDDFVSFNVSSVGRYEISLSVTEDFGQPTISSYITSADYRTGTTKNVITIDNYKPIVSFMAVKEQKIDIDVMTDYEGQDLLDLETRLNTMVNEGYENFLNVKFNIISDKKYVGRYIHQDAEGYTNVMNQDTPKYPVANWNGLIEYSDNSYTVTQSTTRLYTNMTETTNGTFPSRIKASYMFNGNQGRFFLLENGDVYMIGTVSGNNIGFYGHSAMWAMSPRKILSDIKQIEGGDNRYYFLSNTGKVYAFGRTVQTFEQNGSYFTAVYNRCDLSKTLPVIQDPYGGNPYSGGQTYDSIIGTGLFSPVQLTQFSSIDYIWSNGTAFVARKTDGSWKGFGQGLNGFGYPTGYVNTPPTSLGSTSYKSISLSSAMTYYYDNQNTVVDITNLTNLDRAIGGIAKIEPNKAYAKNGDVYEFKETPNALFGKEYFANKDDIPNDGRTYSIEYQYTYYDYTLQKYITTVTVFYPVQVISSQFTYNKIDTWSSLANDRVITYQYFSPDTINSSGVSGVPYLDYATVQPKVMYQSRFSTAPTIPPKSNYFWIDPINSTVFDYKLVAYVTNYTYSNRVYNPHVLWWEDDEEGDEYGPGYDYYYTPSYGPKVLVKESQYLAGWKTYAVDASKITTSTHRDGASKYLLYLAKNDSFKKVSKDIENYIKDEDMAVRVSTKASYVDDYSVNLDSETNLRNLINVNTKGKQYGEDAIELMIADILSENKVNFAPDGGTYVILGEDTITYDQFYRDIENDPKLSEQSKAIHDSTFYKNSMGVSVYHNQLRTVPLTTFDKVGKFEIQYKATDKPSTNFRFAEFNRTSDEETLKVYVHRRPIADFDINYNYQLSNIGISMNNQSYDLDHQGESGNGIAKSTWAYRKNGAIVWVTGTPTTLNYNDEIEISLTVTDVEGATSNTIKSFTMPSEMPLTFGAELQGQNNTYPTTAFQVGNTLEFFNVWSKFNKTHHLETSFWDGATRITGIPIKTVNYSASTATLTGSINYAWKNILMTIPNNIGLVAKTYTARIEAVSNVDTQRVKVDFPVTLVTNRPPTVSFTNRTPTTIFQGSSVVNFILPKDPDGDNLSIEYYYAAPSGNFVLYKSYSNISENVTMELEPLLTTLSGDYSFKVVVSDGKGGVAEATSTAHAYPFKIENLRVNSILDVDWKYLFYDASLNKTNLNINGIKSSDFPIYQNSKFQPINLGYALNFSLDTIGFDESNDYLKITPKFYIRTNTDFISVDLYVKESDSSKYKLISDTLYNSKSVSLTLDDSYKFSHESVSDPIYNTWRFKYYLPPSTLAVRKGETLDLYSKNYLKGNLLVNFDIVGFKPSQSLMYDFTTLNSLWSTGNGSSYGQNFITNRNLSGKGVNKGDIFYYNLNQSVIDDLRLNKEW